MSIPLKSEADIAGMREAGRLASELLDHLQPMIVAGITTKDIDREAHDYMVNVQKTVPATLNYAPPGHSPIRHRYARRSTTSCATAFRATRS